MFKEPVKSFKRVLEPNERISEVLFGLIMVLTFTGSLSVAQAGRVEVRTMLIGALGCNLAWGIIDGAFYLMGCLAEKGRDLMTYRTVRKINDSQKAQRLITDALPRFSLQYCNRTNWTRYINDCRNCPNRPIKRG